MIEQKMKLYTNVTLSRYASQDINHSQVHLGFEAGSIENPLKLFQIRILREKYCFVVSKNYAIKQDVILLLSI